MLVVVGTSRLAAAFSIVRWAIQVSSVGLRR